MKNLNEYPMWVQTLAIPVLYVIMIIKVMEVIPIVIIAGCNTLIEKVNQQVNEKGE